MINEISFKAQLIKELSLIVNDHLIKNMKVSSTHCAKVLLINDRKESLIAKKVSMAKLNNNKDEVSFIAKFELINDKEVSFLHKPR